MVMTDMKLGYLVFEVSNLPAWEKFATEILGLQVSRRDEDGSLALRMDDHEQRILLTPGPADDLATLGWELANSAEMDAVQKRLEAAGHRVTVGTQEEAARRHVAGLVRYVDPGGIPSELCYGAFVAKEPFRSAVVRSGFVTGNQGLGHAVISARSQDESTRFYRDVLGFRLSDHIICDLHGYQVNIAFFHANPRHHTIAFGDAQKKRIHHFMIEARSMDDVGLAFDRALKAGVRIINTLGKHPNDKMFSFYAKTPSGFQFEFGWGGREVDDATWEPTTYAHISEWGHHPPEFLAPKPKVPPAAEGGATPRDRGGSAPSRG
jgi:2,3-dihydroxybiphenyl 1,2-dioxygenase